MATLKNKKHKTTPKAPKINAIHRPANMTPEEWQRALRRQTAEKELYGIRPPHAPGKPFIVRSTASDRTYEVHYYGPSSKFNRCSCMDFKTSRLGTCKHIEAITLAADGKYSGKIYSLPTHSFVYVDYPSGRQIKFYLGNVNRNEMSNLADSLFDHSRTLRDYTCNPTNFIREAMRLDPEFVWEPDAMNLIIECRDNRKRKEIIAEKYSNSDFKGLLKTPLHPYQMDGVRFAFAGGRTINADEMGLGKTVQAIATAELLRKEGLISSVIIICPTSLKYQWLSEIKRFTDSTAIAVEGNLVKRKEQFKDPTIFYKICSFHAMSNNIKARMIPEADLIIFDELQRLKNKDTQMGKQLRKLQSQYVMALSGTPLENKLDELYSVTQLVDQFILGPYYQFTADTTLKDETGKIIGYKNLHKVGDRLGNTLIRRRKADVKLQMPPRTDTILYVPMTKEQRTIHDEYRYQVSILIDKWRRFKFLSEPDRKRLMLFLSMMRMVCDSTFILDQKSRHDTKIEEIKAIISNMLEEGDGKVVIFSQWERMLRILSQELTEAGLDFCFLHGGVPSYKRKDLIDRFREEPDCRIFLSTDAGATGLNLQSASLLINIDLPWNPAVLEQRIARIYRLGQNNPVQIINMVAKDTIEERMLSTLNFKSNLAAGILDGGDDAVFVENSKFDKIVETVDSVISDTDEDCTPSADASQEESDTQQAPETTSSETDSTSPSSNASSNAAEASRESTHNRPTQPAANSSAPAASHRDSEDRQQPHSKQSTPPQKTESTEDMRELVAGGMAILGKLAGALRNPESAAALADALVKEDPETGKSSLNIPVPDKSTVVNLLSAFSALLRGK